MNRSHRSSPSRRFCRRRFRQTLLFFSLCCRRRVHRRIPSSQQRESSLFLSKRFRRASTPFACLWRISSVFPAYFLANVVKSSFGYATIVDWSSCSVSLFNRLIARSCLYAFSRSASSFSSSFFEVVSSSSSESSSSSRLRFFLRRKRSLPHPRRGGGGRISSRRRALLH